MVCQACQDVLLRKAKTCKDKYGVIRRIHHRDIESLRQAVEVEECPLCRNLWENAESMDSETHDTHDQAEAHSLSSPEGPATVGTASSESLFLSSMHTKNNHPLVANFDLFEPGQGWEAGIRNLNLSNSTGITNTKAVASEWLQECCGKHHLCNSSHSRQGWNPTRLLDLQAAGSGIIKLIDHCSSMPPVTYATLSHRWGKAHFLQLTEATEARFKTAIQLVELPKTFMEAVEVATTLGVYYLWIDCLCIVQGIDGQSDWIREASLMHKVYQHGYFNISATASEDAFAGLYHERHHITKQLIEVDVVDFWGITVRCLAQSSNLWSDNVDQELLNRRGWVLQERILSKRVLHFGAGQLYWECRELEASETFPSGKGAAFRPTIKRLDPAEAERWGEDRNHDQRVFEMWAEVMQEYSECSLTDPKDKLPAIMGIAQRVNEILHDIYIAGMWKRDLIRSLAWAPRHDSSLKNARPAEWRAPTWSWASIDGKIGFPGHAIKTPDLSIESVSLNHATEDPYGPLLGGCLYIKGIVRRITIHELYDSVRSRVESVGWEPLFPSSRDFRARRYRLRLDSAHESFQAENEDGTLFCIQLNDTDDFSSEPILLLLLRCDQASSGSFERIGIIEVIYQSREIRALPKGESDLPCISYDAGSGLHIICMV